MQLDSSKKVKVFRVAHVILLRTFIDAVFLSYQCFVKANQTVHENT
jgi:hypothetical protein